MGVDVAYHRNQQFSVTALTNASGTILERYAYSAYGVPTFLNAAGSQISNSTVSNRYLYTGREWDDVLLMYHYRARMYDTALGRFCSRDPIGYAGSTWNLYALYFPMIMVDSMGLACEPPDEEKPCGGLDPDTEKVYHLCMALCKWSLPKFKDPIDFCRKCNMFPQPAKALCKHVCKTVKKDIEWPKIDPIPFICDKACCSGKLPEGMPGDKCIGEFMDDKGNPKSPRTGMRDCEKCCNKEFPLDATKRNHCWKSCQLMGGF